MHARFILSVAGVLLAAWSAVGDDPKAKDKPVVELRWLESKPIKDVTEDKGIQNSEAEGDLVYPHKKPALVLTKKEVSAAKLTKHDFTKNGLGVQCTVALHLTKDARTKLAAGLKGNHTRLITVTVDGKHWTVTRYEIDKDKPFVPNQSRAETFLPEIGFIPSDAAAQRLADAFE